MDLISVIVPVYKVEEYLDLCIQSIVDQTYGDLEIILVDDGSPDRCPEMCDAWAKKDSRIRVIHQKNAGGAAARNVALDVVRGKYISFVDSDDYISPHFYEYLVSAFDDDMDIVECESIVTGQDDAAFDEGELPHPICYTSAEAMQNHILDRCFKQIIWNKLYRKSVVENVRFVPQKRIDDEFFTYRVLGNANKLARLPMRLYAYRQQSDSIMHSIKIDQRIQSIEAKTNRHQYIREHFPNLLQESAVNLVFSCVYMGQLALKEQDKRITNDLKKTAQECHADITSKESIPLKQRVWLMLAKRVFRLTCSIRNLLQIGL